MQPEREVSVPYLVMTRTFVPCRSLLVAMPLLLNILSPGAELTDEITVVWSRCVCSALRHAFQKGECA